MTITALLQAVIALVVVATPWFVVRTARAVAVREGHGSRESWPARRLVLGTIAAGPIVGLLGLVLPTPSLWLALTDGAAFIGLALLAGPVLQQIDRETRQTREVAASERAASLRPRRIEQYVPHSWRALPLTVVLLGVASFGYRLIQPVAFRSLFVPIGFVLASVIFLALYDAWLRQEVRGGQIADVTGLEERRRRRTQAIFITQVILVAGLMVVSHLLLDLNWNLNPAPAIALSLTGGVLGIVGCAGAVASDLGTCRYEVKPKKSAARN